MFVHEQDPFRPSLKHRPLLSPIQAGGMAAVFRVLANDTRLRMLHELIRAKELRVTDLATALGMKPQATSNQLQRLLAVGIVGTRRDSTNIYYRVIDPRVAGMLDLGWCLLEQGSQEGSLMARAAASYQSFGCAEMEP